MKNCGNSHRQFEKKVLEFKQMFGDVKRKVEELTSQASFPIKKLELTIKEHQRFINERKSIINAVIKVVLGRVYGTG